MYLNRFCNILYMADFLRRRIDTLYDTMREIRISIADVYSLSISNGVQNRTSPFQLSRDQRYLIDLYTSMYNITVRQLHYLERYNEQFDFSNRVYINGRAYTIDQISSAEAPAPAQTRTPVPVPVRANENPQRSDSLNLSDFRNLFSETIRQFNTPIVVRPTDAEIELATTRNVFSEIEFPSNTSCPILLTDFEPTSQVTQIIHCGHIFTPAEITRWFQSNVRCPVCRHDIRGNTSTDEATAAAAAAAPSPSPAPSRQPQSQRRSSSNNSRQRRFSTTNDRQSPSLYTYDWSFNNLNDGSNLFSSESQNIFANALNGALGGALGGALNGFTDPSFNETVVFDAIFRM